MSLRPMDGVPLVPLTPPTADPERGQGETSNTPPRPDHNQNLQGDSDSRFDPSADEALFSLYLNRVIGNDKKMVEGWKGDADGILVFTGLFSAAVATLLAVSISDIRQNSQDTSAFYLAHIYQQSSTQLNGSRPSIPSSLSNPAEPFAPPVLGVWVNGLWFLSLVVSLTCALLATLVQQWARRYDRFAYPPYSPQKRARIRAFYKQGVKKSHISRAVEALPLLLHTSLFAFFAGLSVFLFGVHRTIFKVLTVWIGTCIILYACLTVFPVIHKDSPYSTPLSGLSSFCLTGIRYLFFRLQKLPLIRTLIHVLLRNRDPKAVHLNDFFSHRMSKTAEQYALKLDPGIDYRSLLEMFQSLDEDGDLEKFFEHLPRLCDSETGRRLNLREGFIKPNKDILSDALIGLMDRTLIPNLVEASVKHRRMIIFTKAIESKSTSLLDLSRILRRVLFEDWHGLLGCIEFGLSMRNWAVASDKVTVTTFYAQCVATLTTSVASVRKQDESWIQLAKNLPVSSPLHPHEHDDTILLAHAIFIVRSTVQTYSGSEKSDWGGILKVSRRTLGAVCKLDIRQTLPEYQHEFCDLWNKLVRTAQNDQLPHHTSVSVKMLKNIRKLYIALHSTPQTAFHTTDDWELVLDNPSFYPKCTEYDHRPSSSFPELQFNASQSDVPTPSGKSYPQPHAPTHHHVPPSSPSSPHHPPSPSFPVANPHVPSPTGN